MERFYKIFHRLNFFYILFFSFYNFKCYSQSYIPWPDSNAVWNEYGFSLIDGYGGSYYYYLEIYNTDTIIMGEKYSKLFTRFAWPPAPEYRGGIRSDSTGKVFLILKDSSIEFLLYDFSAHLNDTVFNVWPFPYNNEGMIICDEDYVLIGNRYHKRLAVKHYYGDGYGSWMWCDTNPTYSPYGWNYWIEGIGGTNGLLTTYGEGPFEAVNYLQCMSANDTIFFPPSSYVPDSSCDTTIIVNIPNKKSAPVTIKIEPNPFNDIIKVDFINKTAIDNISKIKIFNILGVLLNTIHVNNLNEFLLDLSDLKEGIYFLIITTNETHITQKIIKQND